MMIVAVLSVMAGGVEEGGRKASWREEYFLSLSPTLINYSSLNYLLTLSYWLNKNESQPVYAFFNL